MANEEGDAVTDGFGDDEEFKRRYQQQIVTKRCASTYDNPAQPGHGTMCYQPEGHRGDHTNDADTPWSLRW